jgi:cell wall-associated NlpC family hydrolase
MADEKILTEDEGRAAVVKEAKEWLWTPMHHRGMVKGPQGGVDCATFPSGVFAACGLFEAYVREYNAQWWAHKENDWYVEELSKYMDEVPGPPERALKPGDMVLYQFGRVMAHGVIVVDWPLVIHMNPNAGFVNMDRGDNAPLLVHRRRRYFRLKGWS